MENCGVEQVVCRGGVTGFKARVRESEKEGRGLGPLSFINLNVYIS